MKIAITGHTKGIGKAIFEELTKRQHQVQGFSRSNAYDIGLSSCREEIISEVRDYDVFINNAYCKDSQFEMLKRIVEHWEGKNKIIININSKCIFATAVPEFMNDYVQDKIKQHQFLNQRKFKARPYVTDVILGLVDTQMSEVFKAKKLDPVEVASFIADSIEKHDSMYVQEVVIDVPYQDWQDSVQLLDRNNLRINIGI